jgi:orotate phosphoribosyltransferase
MDSAISIKGQKGRIRGWIRVPRPLDLKEQSGIVREINNEWAEQIGMSETTAAAFLDLVDCRRGHYRLESGHHRGLWLDLDPLFAEPRRIAPFVDALTNALRPHNVSVVCGPLLGGAFLAQLVAHALDAEFCFTERAMSGQPGDLYRARYLLPPAFAARIRGKRVAIVDDVMSAGSALRGTYAELQTRGAVTVVAGALLVLGSTGAGFFSEHDVPVEAAARDDCDLWLPADCPLCAAGLPLEDVAAPAADRAPSGWTRRNWMFQGVKDHHE